MSKFIHGIMAGHGGIDPNTGQYVTAPRKMARFGDGLEVYEGVENRNIVSAILARNVLMGNKQTNVIDLLNGTWKDVPLGDRVDIINDKFDELKKQGKQLLLWEIHNNAFKPNKAEGREIYTTRKNNFSDTVATVWWNEAQKVIPSQKVRTDWSDGDPDKEADFYVIRKAKCFGTLTECFFFDNRSEIEKYCNPQGYQKWAEIFINSMKEIDRKFG